MCMVSAETPIKLLEEDWLKIKQELISIRGPAGLINWVLKREQGWTWRQPYYGEPVSIDFWNDSAKSMFLLTYSHLITKSLKLFNKNNG
jgi:hypothetical protein